MIQERQSGFLTGIDIQLMEEKNSFYFGMNKLGLLTAIVLRYTERIGLLNEENQKQVERLERGWMDGWMGGWWRNGWMDEWMEGGMDGRID